MALFSTHDVHTYCSLAVAPEKGLTFSVRGAYRGNIAEMDVSVFLMPHHYGFKPSLLQNLPCCLYKYLAPVPYYQSVRDVEILGPDGHYNLLKGETMRMQSHRIYRNFDLGEVASEHLYICHLRYSEESLTEFIVRELAHLGKIKA